MTKDETDKFLLKTPDKACFNEIKRWDNLDQADFLMLLEEELCIDIDDNAQDSETVDQLADYLCAKF